MNKSPLFNYIAFLFLGLLVYEIFGYIMGGVDTFGIFK